MRYWCSILFYAIWAVGIAACGTASNDLAGSDTQYDDDIQSAPLGFTNADGSRPTGNVNVMASSLAPVTDWNPSEAIDLGSTYTGTVTIDYDIVFSRAYSALAIGYADPATVIDGPNKLNLGIVVDWTDGNQFKAIDDQVTNYDQVVRFGTNLKTYHVKIIADTTARMYSVWITVPTGDNGSAPGVYQIANGYLFRLDAPSGDIRKVYLKCAYSNPTDYQVINHTIASSSTCTPSCTGRVCGSDGCGGSCGTCAAGQTCSAGGQCSAESDASFTPVTTWNPASAVDLGATYSQTVTIEYDIKFNRAYGTLSIGYTDPATIIDGLNKLNLGIVVDWTNGNQFKAIDDQVTNYDQVVRFGTNLKTYHVKIIADTTARMYSAWITVPTGDNGSAPGVYRLASNYRFRQSAPSGDIRKIYLKCTFSNPTDYQVIHHTIASSGCTPSCSGRVCGSDGCGGSCGSCSAGQGCGPSGQCMWQYFPSGAPYYQSISAKAPDSNSQSIINYINGRGGFGTGGLRITFSFQVEHVTNPATAPFRSFIKLANSFYTPDCDDVTVPIPTVGAVEDSTTYRCGNINTQDCHLIVDYIPTQSLYEQWRVDITGGTYLGGCLAVWEKNIVYPPQGRGDGCTTADAAGLPIAPLNINPDEVASGAIDHALRFILPNDRIRHEAFVHPATHSTSATSGAANGPPFGTQLRLKAAFNLNLLPNAGARVVARALQRYGMYLADGGTIPLTAEIDQFTTAKWNGLLGSNDLSAIRITDFEVMPLGTVFDQASISCTR